MRTDSRTMLFKRFLSEYPSSSDPSLQWKSWTNLLLCLLSFSTAILPISAQEINSPKKTSKPTSNQESTSHLIEKKTEIKISNQFEEAFYKHNRPFYYTTDLISKLGDLLNIRIGGKDKVDFIGFGYKDQSLRWDGKALENSYHHFLDLQTKKYDLRGNDIPNGYDSSLLKELLKD